MKPKAKTKQKPARQLQVITKNDLPSVHMSEGDKFRAELRSLASNKSVDIGKYQALLEMHRRYLDDQRSANFNIALASAQAQIRPVVADKNNTSTKSRYASYAALDRVVRPVCETLGLNVSFDAGEMADPLMQRVLALVSHSVKGDIETGHTRTYHLDVPADGKGAKGGDVMTRTHAVISAVTYGQSKLLKMIFNIPVVDKREDDDGNAAGSNVDLVALISEQDIMDITVATNDATDTDEGGKKLRARLCEALGIKAIKDMPASQLAQAKQKIAAFKSNKAAAMEKVS